jgi:hypothetical protein
MTAFNVIRFRVKPGRDEDFPGRTRANWRRRRPAGLAAMEAVGIGVLTKRA